MGAAQVQPQTRLGRYELLARLATGGMGEIFLARLEGAAGFEKLYVVKRILPHLADDARFRQMLIAEASIASKLSHANICQVYELGDENGQLYIVMEYLEGITLLPLLRRASREGTPLDLGFIGGVMQQACDALHYAHELKDRSGDSFGIVHRDVTPSNIFLTESGIAKLLDFGIAKAKGASGANTQTGTVKGKYAYMAPEQLRGQTAVDRRVDVFALGVVLYEMIALRRLFQRKTDYLTFRAVMEQPIPDVRIYRADTPDALAEVLTKALDREPTQRYETVRQLSAAMFDALGVRPWSQADVGDYVRSNFASDLGKRTHQVHNAISRTMPGATPRTTMPLIQSPDDDPTTIDDEDTEFPPVETAVDHPPARLTPPQADFNAGTPPPFGGPDSTSSGAEIHIQPLVRAPVAKPARNLLWPLIAIGMFLIAGGALALVYMTVLRQPPTNVTITSTTRPPDPPPLAATDAGVLEAPADAAAQAKPQGSVYDRVITSLVPRMNDCMARDPSATVPTAALIHIAPDGHPTRVTLQPEPANGSALGACLITVLQGGRFPKAAAEADLRFPFTKR
jgi:eukaryotic-like serine/threonine-protein kinase